MLINRLKLEFELDETGGGWPL